MFVNKLVGGPSCVDSHVWYPYGKNLYYVFHGDKHLTKGSYFRFISLAFHF